MLRLAHGAAWVAALVALWVYALTLSPTVAWVNLGEDSGDLLAASATLGIPHPTGYPLFVLLGRLASLIPLGSIAFRINLVAALAGAAGVYFLTRYVAELTARDDASPRDATVALVAAGGAALLYAFSRGAWSQSVLAEVYTLNVAFLGAILWCCARADRREDVRWLALAAFLFGLGLTNHLLLLAAAPAVVWSAGRALATQRIGMPGIVLLLLLAAWGATLVLYLPIRAGLPSGPGKPGPEFSWGVPSTPARLWWVLSGEQYRQNFFARDAVSMWTHLVPGRWWTDWGWGLVALGAGLAAAARHGFRRMGPGLAALAATVALLSLYAIGDDVGYWMPVFWIVAALAGAGAAALGTGDGRAGRSVATVASAALLVAAGWNAVAHARSVDASKDLTPYVYAHRNLSAVEPDAVIISEYDGRTFSLWFYKATDFRESHPRLVVAYKYLLLWPWYGHHLARTYPWLRVPSARGDLDDAMNLLIARNLDRHPVYLTRLDPGLAPVFEAEPVGYPSIPLYRIRWATP